MSRTLARSERMLLRKKILLRQFNQKLSKTCEKCEKEFSTAYYHFCFVQYQNARRMIPERVTASFGDATGNRLAFADFKENIESSEW
jgi:hypothetical protein